LVSSERENSSRYNVPADEVPEFASQGQQNKQVKIDQPPKNEEQGLCQRGKVNCPRDKARELEELSVQTRQRFDRVEAWCRMIASKYRNVSK
jgi:hypothetical protein